MKRRYDKKTWEQIAKEVRNEKGKRPYWKVVRAAFRDLSANKGHLKKDRYHNCGRKKVLTGALTKWLLKKLKLLRMSAECTSTDLQLCLAREQHPHGSPKQGQWANMEI